ncbi:hypothetical protein MD484_g2649, partial [Candolleomyces efflorescens]
MDVEPSLLSEPDAEDADSLVSTNDPDDLANEQTWPTEEEMNGGHDGLQDQSIPDAVPGTTPKAVKRIPKGMSEYQAAWIIDETDEEDGEGEVSNAGHGEEDQEDEEMEEMVDMPVDEETDNQRSVRFQDLDVEEEAEQLEKWRSRNREEEDDAAFPDEIDTPQDVSARQRFARYRGMRSFRTSPWDPYENLPRDYARIFQFEDFKRTERSVRRRAEHEVNVVEPGTRVTIHINDVPQEAANTIGLTVFSLFQHEHKVTALNFTVQRNTEYEGSVRSKDPLIICVGPRRLSVNPVYSQLTRGGAPHLVAYGSFLNTDTTRIVAKRIILSGHPFKVHKKTATIRYMFFNSDDIQYFKPIQLHTKYGRVGHIKESLGTHGYFKAYFDGPINQMDTVCMSLYKRVYPKWYQLARCQANNEKGPTDDAMMEE